MNTYDDYEKEVAEYENYYDNYNSGFNKRNLIIKIIIIIVCIGLLIWLFALLKNNNRNIVYDENLHNSNVEKVRLAAEKYFFIDNNLPVNNTKTINLKTLIDKGLVEEIVDANKKVCNDNKSTISLSKNSSYVLTINLSCSTDEKEEIFFYDLTNLSCQNCNGKTIMDGKNIKQQDDKPIVEPVVESGYSCKECSNWQSEREDNEMLSERVRTLVKGVKKGETITKKVYGNWSEYILNPILEEANIEIEKMEKVESKWSENKETTSPITSSDKIKIVDTRTTGGESNSYCASGYSRSGNICVSDAIYTADLTPSQYNSYYVINKPCNDSKTEYQNGKFVLVRKGCRYRLTDSLKTSSSPSVTTYVYQELEEYPVTYYRYRDVKTETIKQDDIYTTEYFEENNLPQGYTKVPGSEKKEYSYKISVCEK